MTRAAVANQGGEQAGDAPNNGRVKPLFDYAGLDVTKKVVTREAFSRWLPHRDVMLLPDGILWQSDDFTRVAGVKHLRDDEFWVSGHFPGKPMFPGVLMVETAAQIACYMHQVRQDKPSLVAFLRIEEATFRSMAVPGDDLIVLVQEIKYSKRRFVSAAQGWLGDRIVFESQVSGITMGDRPGA